MLLIAAPSTFERKAKKSNEIKIYLISNLKLTEEQLIEWYTSGAKWVLLSSSLERGFRRIMKFWVDIRTKIMANDFGIEELTECYAYIDWILNILKYMRLFHIKSHQTSKYFSKQKKNSDSALQLLTFFRKKKFHPPAYQSFQWNRIYWQNEFITNFNHRLMERLKLYKKRTCNSSNGGTRIAHYNWKLIWKKKRGGENECDNRSINFNW